jgi:protein TonB
MFSNLIESGSHAADLKRRGRFFAGALAFYGLLLAAAGVGSVYAFNAHLDDVSDDEVYAILRFQPAEPRSEPARRETPRPAAAPHRSQQFATRPEISINTPYKGGRIASATTREVKANAAVVIAPFTSDPEPGGVVVGPQAPGGLRHPHGGGEGPRVLEAGPPPPPVPPRAAATPAPPPRTDKPLALSSALITSKALHKPVPPYPQVAKVAGIEGTVAVSILVSEQGQVVSARATSGNPLLQNAAVQAARQARFTPTMLNGQPVKVTGVITYNFTLR